MNLNILKRLSAQQLQQLRDAADKELHLRLDFSIEVGRFGSFCCNSGIKRTVRVVRINPKTIAVVETAVSHIPGMRWNVPRAILNMEGLEVEGAIKPAVVEQEAPHQLQTKSDMVW